MQCGLVVWFEIDYYKIMCAHQKCNQVPTFKFSKGLGLNYMIAITLTNGVF